MECADVFFPEIVRKPGEKPERVVPERLDLNRLAVARCNRPIADPRVHPGQLRPGIARCEQAVRIHVNTEARAAYVPADDVFQLLVQPRTNQFHVLRVFEVLANSFEEPQSGIDGIVIGGPVPFRESVRQHTLIDAAGGCQQDVTGDVEPAGGQRQSGERNHRVTAPIGKPGIPGKYRSPRSALHDEPGGCGCERCDQRIVNAENSGAAPDLVLLEGRRFVRAVSRCRRDRDGSLMRRKIELQHTGTEQIFLEIESSFALHRIFEMEIPMASALQCARVVRKVKLRERGIGLDRKQSGALIEISVQSGVLMCEIVVSAKCDERTQFQPAFRAVRLMLNHFIFNGDGILALNHEDTFLDRYAACPERKNRKRIEAKLPEIPIALRMHRARIQICRQLEAPVADDQRLFQLRKQEVPDSRGLGGGDQQPVVAASVRARDRRRRKAAETVGLQPLMLERLGKVFANTPIEPDAGHQSRGRGRLFQRFGLATPRIPEVLHTACKLPWFFVVNAPGQ